MASLIGTDIGGTFTDVVHLDEKTGQISFSKVLTNYSDPTDGIVDGISEIIKKNNLKPKEISRILHGTTLVTNAVIERRGVKTGLITTLGFEDVLEIGVGFGSDHSQIALNQPKSLTGIDLTERAINNTKIRFELLDLQSNLLVDNAENLSFESESFDALYSYGVLHHSPNTKKCFEDCYLL